MTSKALAHTLFRCSSGHSFGDLTDDSLARLRITYESGLLDSDDPGFVYAGGSEKQVRRWLKGVVAEQEKRGCLADIWWAREDGTDSTVVFHRQFDVPGGAERFFAGEGIAPNYWLALMLDFRCFKDCGKSAMAWEAM